MKDNLQVWLGANGFSVAAEYIGGPMDGGAIQLSPYNNRLRAVRDGAVYEPVSESWGCDYRFVGWEEK